MVETEKYEGLIASIAYEFSRKYRMVDVHDVRQELWVWFLEHPNKVRLWESLEGKQATKLIARSLRNKAKDFCQKEKANAVGYRVEDNYYYDKDVVKLLLPAVLRGDMVAPSLNDIGFTSTKSVASEGGNWYAMGADIEVAIDKLTEEQRAVIYLRFDDGVDDKSYAKEMGISEDAARMRVNRALNNLMNILGGKRPVKERDYTEEEVNGTEHTGESPAIVDDLDGEDQRFELD